MRRILALILVLSFAISATATVYANVQITHITDATVTQIVSTSAIRVQMSDGRTALVRIHGVSPIIGVPNNNDHARAFLHNSVLGRDVRLLPPGGIPQMDGRFNVMIVLVDAVNIAERINGDTLAHIVDVLPPRPTFADIRFAGQLFVNRNGHFIPHYRGDGFDNEPLWFMHDGQFFRFNPFNTERTLLYFRSNGHFYPFFPGGNINFTGNLYYIDESGRHQNYIPGVTDHIGRVYFWSQGAYHLYAPWFWGQMNFPGNQWENDRDPWQWTANNVEWEWDEAANAYHWPGTDNSWTWDEDLESFTWSGSGNSWLWGESEHSEQWWNANNPWYWAGTNNPWQWGEEHGHPFRWHIDSPGAWIAQNPGQWNADGTGPWDTANNQMQFGPVNDPWFSHIGEINPWQMGFVNYPNLGFIWKPQLYFREEANGNMRYTPYFPGITDFTGQLYILQGAEFQPFNPRFEGPREWEYFNFEGNALELFHNFRESQWDMHVGQLYYFDHTAGRFLPFLGQPAR